MLSIWYAAVCRRAREETVLDFGRFTVSIMLEDHYANHANFVIGEIQNIKDLTDLEDFISYL